MVWVVRGRLKQERDDVGGGPDAFYLRPSRLYQMGRLPGPFEGVRKKEDPLTGESTRKVVQENCAPRFRDFTALPTTAMSKKGVWDLITGAWTRENVTDEMNQEPYTLTFYATSFKTTIWRKGVAKPMTKGTTTRLESGDEVQYMSDERFSVEWIPFNICISQSLIDKHASDIFSAAVSGGYKIHHAISKYTTHYSVSSLALSPTLACAALNRAHIVSSRFLLNALPAAIQCPDHPANIELPSESLGEKEMEKEISVLSKTYEKVQVGADFRNYWGHSEMELDWDAGRPAERDYMHPAYQGDFMKDSTPEMWMVNDEREQMFAGILFVLIDDIEEVDPDVQTLVEQGGGAFLSLKANHESKAPRLLQQIADAIATAELPEDTRVVLVKDRIDYSVALRGHEDAQARLLRDVAQNLGVPKFCRILEILESVAFVDLSLLFKEEELIDEETQLGSDPPEKGKGRMLAPESSAIQESTPSSSLLPTSSFAIEGTHPEEGTLNFRYQTRDRHPTSSAVDLSAETGPSTHAVEEPVPTVARKLTRRAKKIPSSSGVFDDLGNNDSAVRTQVPGRELSPDTASTAQAMDLESSFVEPSIPATRKRTMVRRAGTTQGSSQEDSSLLDHFKSDRPAKKPRHETIEEEESQSQLSAPPDDISTPSARMDDERVVEIAAKTSVSTSSRRKRGISEALSDDDTSAARKTTTSRRLRSTTAEIEERPVSQGIAEAPRSSQKVAPAAKGKKGTLAAKKAEKELEKEKAKVDDGFMKVGTSKKKASEIERALNEDFNALKIVRPTFAPMRSANGVRMGWNDIDHGEEELRLEREAMDKEDRPEAWTQGPDKRGSFIVEYVDFSPRQKVKPRTDLVLAEKWAGRPNFKGFKRKEARRPPPEIELYFSEPEDFGLGGAYHTQPKKPRPNAKPDDMEETQSKLTFKSAPKSKATPKKAAAAKGKGKAKVIVADSDDESDEEYSRASSNTVKADDMDVDPLEDDDEFDSDPPVATGRGKAPAKKKAVAAKPSVSKRAPARKGLSVVEDDGDSDDAGRTFKGFRK